MPKTKIEDVIFTAIMATVMVYGMIVYNVALNTGGVVSGFTFLAATHELVFMAPIAFVLEFFVVSKLAGNAGIHGDEDRRTDHSLSPMRFQSASAASCARP